METRPRLLAILLGAVFLVAGAVGLSRERLPERRITLGDPCHTPARVLAPLGAGNGRTAVVFHGLAASAAVMEPLGQSLAVSGWHVYLLDLAGHGRSAAPFSYANADSCAAGAVAYLERNGRIRPGKTALIGHSLGAAVVLGLAKRFGPAATVAISPAPVALPRPIPGNLLVLAGQFDLGPVKKMARALVDAAGGMRVQEGDFADHRAVVLHVLGAQDHGSTVLDPAAWRLIDEWVDRSTNAGAEPSIPTEAVARPLAALLAEIVLLVGLVFLVAPLEKLVATVFFVEPPAAPAPRPGPDWRGTLLRWALASFCAASIVALLRLPVFVRPVRLEDGDWAALVALVTGLILVVLVRRSGLHAMRFEPRAQAFAAVSAIAIVLTFGFALRPELVEVSFHVERIWRWVALVGFTWLYFVVEESVLGEPSGWRRFTLFLGMRTVVWLAQLFVLLVFWRWGLLLVLLAPGFVVFSIGQRFAADALRRRGAGVTSAALFDAILAAAVLALVLPIT